METKPFAAMLAMMSADQVDELIRRLFAGGLIPIEPYQANPACDRQEATETPQEA